MSQIVPALLVKSEKEFETNLRVVENDCTLIQVDVLDGTLFPNTSWYDPRAIGTLKMTVQIEGHFMVENPIPIIETFQKHKIPPVYGFVNGIHVEHNPCYSQKSS